MSEWETNSELVLAGPPGDGISRHRKSYPMNRHSSAAIPLIEWRTDDIASTATAIDDACRRFGFFFLTNHGVSPHSIAATFEETRQFYARPLDEKRRFNCSAASQFLGYRGLGAEKSLMHSGGEACEQYRIGNTVATPKLLDQADIGIYCEPFGDASILFKEMVELGNRLMSVFARGLGLGNTFFDRFMEAPLHRLGLNYYKVGGSQSIGNSVGYSMSPHVDHAVFTALTQSQPGLEVLNLQDEWMEVHVAPDALFIFLGDYMQRWTNGTYHAAKHRVAEVSENRMSIQYKHRPSYATVVAPLSPFVSEDAPARYEQFDTGRQYEHLLRSLLAERAAG